MENTIKVKQEINRQEIIFDVVVKASNDYILKMENSDAEMTVRELAKDRKTIILYKPYKIAGEMVREIEITDEQLKEIEKIEEEHKQEAINRDKKLKEDLINGVTTIKVNHRKSGQVSGYIIFGHEADLLKDLGIAKSIGGWRTIVDKELIEALGEEFTYQQAKDYAGPVMEKRRKEEAEREAKRKEAKDTGEKVALRSWQEKCNNSRMDCDLDELTE